MDLRQFWLEISAMRLLCNETAPSFKKWKSAHHISHWFLPFELGVTWFFLAGFPSTSPAFMSSFYLPGAHRSVLLTVWVFPVFVLQQRWTGPIPLCGPLKEWSLFHGSAVSASRKRREKVNLELLTIASSPRKWYHFLLTPSGQNLCICQHSEWNKLDVMMRWGFTTSSSSCTWSFFLSLISEMSPSSELCLICPPTSCCRNNERREEAQRKQTLGLLENLVIVERAGWFGQFRVSLEPSIHLFYITCSLSQLS